MGFGTIGREVFADWSAAFERDTYMVTDLTQTIPEGHEWDGEPVDVAVILVDTPRLRDYDGFDYRALCRAIEQYESVADFILVRSTVSLGFLTEPTYVANAARIGFSPEFYGATKWSSRAVLDIPFTVFTSNTPWGVIERVGGNPVLLGTPEEVIVAKLAENAFLATKVTFFHELALLCAREGIDFENVRSITTSDPRIGAAHSHMEEYGWQSHCFDKDVPAFVRLGPETTLVAQVIDANQRLLNRRSATTRIGE